MTLLFLKNGFTLVKIRVPNNDFEEHLVFQNSSCSPKHIFLPRFFGIKSKYTRFLILFCNISILLEFCFRKCLLKDWKFLVFLGFSKLKILDLKVYCASCRIRNKNRFQNQHKNPNSRSSRILYCIKWLYYLRCYHFLILQGYINDLYIQSIFRWISSKGVLIFSAIDLWEYGIFSILRSCLFYNLLLRKNKWYYFCNILLSSMNWIRKVIVG